MREYTGYLDIKSIVERLQDAKDSIRESATSSLDGSLRRVYPVQMTSLDSFEGTLEELASDPDLIKMQTDAKAQTLDGSSSLSSFIPRRH